MNRRETILYGLTADVEHHKRDLEELRTRQEFNSSDFANITAAQERISVLSPILQAVNAHNSNYDILAALDEAIKRLSDSLLNCRFRASCTSMFHNAMELERGEVASRLHRELTGYARSIREEDAANALPTVPN